MPPFSSIPIVWASDGDWGRGGTLGARLDDEWLPWGKMVGEGCPVDDVGLLF
jgi:hypothetical protein